LANKHLDGRMFCHQDLLSGCQTKFDQHNVWSAELVIWLTGIEPTQCFANRTCHLDVRHWIDTMFCQQNKSFDRQIIGWHKVLLTGHVILLSGIWSTHCLFSRSWRAGIWSTKWLVNRSCYLTIWHLDDAVFDHQNLSFYRQALGRHSILSTPLSFS